VTADLAAQMRQMPFLVPLRLSFRGGLVYRVVVGFDLGFGLAGYEIDLERTYSRGVKGGCGHLFISSSGSFDNG
jgi:hypothetical protein